MEKNFLESIKNRSGIYEIIINKKSYIGSSINLKSRLEEHQFDLKRNRHTNKKLQRAYNKYNEFFVNIIEFCDNNLLEREEYWYKIKGYYNLINPRKTVNKQCKKVYQFSLEGKYINTFNSISEAGRITNINPSAIGLAIRNKTYYSGGYFWNYTKNIIPKRKNHWKKVYMFDLKGKYIKSFESSYEAARYIKFITNSNISVENIGGRIKTSILKNQTTYKYVFSYEKILPQKTIDLLVRKYKITKP